MASFFWTTFIAFHLYYTYLRQEGQAKYTNCVYHVISWGVPMVIVVIAFGMHVLGSDLSVGSGAWCWISACLSPIKRTVWMLCSGKAWEVGMYGMCMVFYILIKWKKYTKGKGCPRISISESSVQQNKDEEDKPEDIRFLLLWLVEVTLRTAGTIRFFVAVAKRHSGSVSDRYDSFDKVLLSIQSLGDSGQAFCSFLIFCVFNKEMRKILKSKFLVFKKCCKRNAESTSLLHADNP